MSFEVIQLGGLSHKVSLYVPSTYGVSNAVGQDTHRAVTESVAKRLSGLFGGATAYPTQGYYVASDGALVVEAVTVVAAHCAALTDETLEAVFEIATDLREEFKQESIALEIDHTLYFV